MEQTNWLSLTDYSNRFKVSISTLRRRIKTGRVEHNFREGKYYLKDAPLSQHQMVPTNTHTNNTNVKPSQEEVSASVATAEAVTPTSVGSSTAAATEGVSQTIVDGLLNEIKKAYAQVLQEKTEQILQLREEVEDLKTLSRILENENERLKNNAREAVPIDSWLESIK